MFATSDAGIDHCHGAHRTGQAQHLALDGVDLTLELGRIHALVGENGAGKSTLMNILYGFYQADSGEILVDGKPTAIRGPQDAIAAGIGMVHQELSIIPDLSVAENLERVTAGMAQMYPGRVQAPRASGDGDGARRPSPVSRSSVTEGRAPRDAKTFESLPKESRDAFKRYEKMIAGKGKPLTKEEWTREYYAQFQE